MEQRKMDVNEQVLVIRATSFPDGVLQAHQQLHAAIGFDGIRRFYGISWFNPDGTITYLAAVSALDAGEGERRDMETMVLESGIYNALMIRNFRSDIPAIGKAFRQLLELPERDPKGICVEYYPNTEDVYCMVRCMR